MPIYDLFCPSCGDTQDDIILKMDEVPPVCIACGASMARVCNCHSFELVYNNKTDLCDWAGNTSQYWNEYNKQKAEGKNVRINELDGD